MRIRREKEKKVRKIYSGADQLPTGRASDKITEGVICLEGGAWRGVYTVGVLDALMMADINFRTSVGISAGSLSGVGYTTGQIGWGARIDLLYRHDPRYCGRKAMLIERGIMGYHYMFNYMFKEEVPLDAKRLKETPRKLYVGATNVETGRLEFFEKGQSNFLRGLAASASVPYLSKPIMIEGVPYLDGGCVDKIPYEFARSLGEEKIVVVRTREREYRRKEGPVKAAHALYKKYPEFVESIDHANSRFNAMVDQLEQEEREGRIFQIIPSAKVEVSRFEGDMEKLGALYWQGYHDAENALPALRRYLGCDQEEISRPAAESAEA